MRASLAIAEDGMPALDGNVADFCHHLPLRLRKTFVLSLPLPAKSSSNDATENSKKLLAALGRAGGCRFLSGCRTN